MEVERDYLFYGLRAKQDQEKGEEKEAGDTEKFQDGLCWLKFSLEKKDCIDSSVPKFFTASPSHQILNVVRDNVVPFLQKTSSTLERWIIIWNDRAGGKLAKQWLDHIVLPILNFAGISISQIQVYESKQFDWEHKFNFDRCIILGGDGTVSDFLNELNTKNLERSRIENEDNNNKIKFNLIIIPLGTANAMFHAFHPELKDLTRPKEILSGLINALLESTRRADGIQEPLPPKPTLACIRIIDKDGRRVEELVSSVVTSTCLHASILDTANELLLNHDHQFEGTQIFKQAFQKNASRIWNASVKILPSKSHHLIEIYDPCKEKLGIVSVDDSVKHEGITLDGPFSYFTSCLVDRLESRFVIAPLRNSNSPSLNINSTMDLIIVRPMRDSNLAQLDRNSQNFQDSMIKSITSVMDAAYQEGHHIKLLSHNDQIPIVEYYRCGGWIWTPIDYENMTHQVCIDGKIIGIPQGGSVECTVLPEDETDIRMY